MNADRPGNAPAAGIFTVAFRDALHGILAGGDLEQDTRTRNVAVSSDGGKTWTLATNAPFKGAAFGLSYTSAHDQGPNNKGVVHHRSRRRGVVSRTRARPGTGYPG